MVVAVLLPWTIIKLVLLLLCYHHGCSVSGNHTPEVEIFIYLGGVFWIQLSIKMGVTASGLGDWGLCEVDRSSCYSRYTERWWGWMDFMFWGMHSNHNLHLHVRLRAACSLVPNSLLHSTGRSCPTSRSDVWTDLLVIGPFKNNEVLKFVRHAPRLDNPSQSDHRGWITIASPKSSATYH